MVLHCKHIVSVDSLSRTIGKNDWSTNCQECKKWVRIRAMASRIQKLQWMKGRLRNANGAKSHSDNAGTVQDAFSVDGST